jgi:hypothetical protein
MEALAVVLSFQGTKAQPDMKAVHEVAVLLDKAVDEDSSASVRGDAIFAMRYLYPVKFKPEHKEVLDSLIFRMRDKGADAELKQRIAKTLQALTGQDFGLDPERWDAWFTKVFNMRPRAAAGANKAAPADK